MFISNVGLQFYFFVASLSGFGIRLMVASQNEFGSLLSSAIFWKKFEWNSPVKPSAPGLLFVGRFYSFDFHACDGSVKIFYFFLVQFWNVMLFYEFIHFLQVVHFIVIQLLIVVSYDPLYFCVVCCDFSIFISNFVDLILLPFFLANGLSILFIFSKNQLLVQLIFAIVSFVSLSFISALIFMISFLLLTLGFFISFYSSCFRCKFRLFI